MQDEFQHRRDAELLQKAEEERKGLEADIKALREKLASLQLVVSDDSRLLARCQDVDALQALAGAPGEMLRAASSFMATCSHLDNLRSRKGGDTLLHGGKGGDTASRSQDISNVCTMVSASLRRRGKSLSHDDVQGLDMLRELTGMSKIYLLLHEDTDGGRVGAGGAGGGSVGTEGERGEGGERGAKEEKEGADAPVDAARPSSENGPLLPAAAKDFYESALVMLREETAIILKVVTSLLVGGWAPEKWIPDKDVSHCKGCQRVFGFSLRKHHCRCCGSILCNICSDKGFNFSSLVDGRKDYSSYPARWIDIGGGSERVCDQCFRVLSKTMPLER